MKITECVRTTDVIVQVAIQRVREEERGGYYLRLMSGLYWEVKNELIGLFKMAVIGDFIGVRG